MIMYQCRSSYKMCQRVFIMYTFLMMHGKTLDYALGQISTWVRSTTCTQSIFTVAISVDVPCESAAD